MIQLTDQSLRLFIALSSQSKDQSDVQKTLAAMAAEILRLRAGPAPRGEDDDLACRAAGVFLRHYIATHGGPEEKARVGFNAGVQVLRSAVVEEMTRIRVALSECVKAIEDWPQIQPEGDYLHGWVLQQARSALSPKQG